MYRHMNSYDHFIYEFICMNLNSYMYTCSLLFFMIISYMNSHDS